MNISSTGIEQFQENDFQHYTNLKTLEMKGLTITENGIPDALWAPLTQLEYLDLSGTNGDYKFPKKLPNSIKYLHVNEYHNKEQLDLTMLDKLVELHMAQSAATNLPKLNQKAPIVMINIKQSEGMEDLHYNQIAPFCLLKTLVVDHHTKLELPPQLEQCCGILLWVKTYNIDGVIDVHCSSKNTYTFTYFSFCFLILHQKKRDYNFILCYYFQESCASANVKISSAATNIRHECLVRHGLALNRFWINVLIIVITAIILSLLGYLGYRLYSRFLSGELIRFIFHTSTYFLHLI